MLEHIATLPHWDAGTGAGASSMGRQEELPEEPVRSAASGLPSVVGCTRHTVI